MAKPKSTVTLKPLINLFVFTLLASLAKTRNYMQAVLPDTALQVNTTISVLRTYGGTKDQCDVLMIANSSEGNLRQAVVIL